MNKTALKFWVICLVGIVAVSLFFSCKTTDLSKIKKLEDLKANLIEKAKENTLIEVKNESQINENEVRELVSLLQSLNIGFDGKELSDKLDFLLKKTDEGTKITIQGKGTANYTEINKKEFESLKKQLFKKQDSMFRLQHEQMTAFKLELYQYFKQKDKEVVVKGFQTGTYITIAVVLIALAVLAWMAKKFKIPDKIKSLLATKGG